MNEKEKYEIAWGDKRYRVGAGGINYVSDFLKRFEIDKAHTVIEFGCGEGKAAAQLATVVKDIILVDIAENCLSDKVKASLGNKFVLHDISEPLDMTADYGFCVDTMEHFPPDQLDRVLENMFAIAPKCYFQICTVPDGFGKIVGAPLHLSVFNPAWWKDKMSENNRTVTSIYAKEAMVMLAVEK